MKSKVTLRDNLIYLVVGLVAVAFMCWLGLADLTRASVDRILGIFVLVVTCGALVYGLTAWAISTRKDELRKPRFWASLLVTVGLFAFVEWHQARLSFLRTLPLLLLALLLFGVLIELLRYLESKKSFDRRHKNDHGP